MTSKALLFIILACVSNSQRALTFMDGDSRLIHSLSVRLATFYIRKNACHMLNINEHKEYGYVYDIKSSENKITSSAAIKNLFANTSKIINNIKYDEKQIKKQIKNFFEFYSSDYKYLVLQTRKNHELSVDIGVELGKTFNKEIIQVKSYQRHDLNQIICVLTLFSESYSTFKEIEDVMIRFNFILLLFEDLSKRLQVEPLFQCKFNRYTFDSVGLLKHIKNIQFKFCEFFKFTKLKNTEGLYKKLYEYEQTKEIHSRYFRSDSFESYNEYKLKIKNMFVLCNFYKQMFDDTLKKCTKTCKFFENNVKHLSTVKKKLTYEINKIKLDETKELSENMVFYNLLFDMNDILWIILLELHFLNKVILEFTFERLYDCDAKLKYYSSEINNENNSMIEISLLHKHEYFSRKLYIKHLENDLDEMRLKILIDSLQIKEKNKENLGESIRKKHDDIFKNLQFKTYLCYIRLLYFFEKTNQYTISAALFNNSTFVSDSEDCREKLKENIHILERSFENSRNISNDDGIQKIVDYANDFLSYIAQLKSQNNSFDIVILNSEVKSLITNVYKRVVSLINVDFNAKKLLKYKIDPKFKKLFSAIGFYDKINSFHQEFVNISAKKLIKSKKNNLDLTGQFLNDLIKVLTVFDAIEIKIDTLKNSFPFVNFCDFNKRLQIENQVHELIEKFRTTVDLNYKGVLDKCRCIYQGAILLNKEDLAKTINEIYSESAITRKFYFLLIRFDNIMYQTQKDKNIQEYINSSYCYINIEVLMNISKNSDNENKNISEKSYLYDLDDRVDNIVSILRYLLVFEPKSFIYQLKILISKYLVNAKNNETDYYYMFLRLIDFNRNKLKKNSKRETDGIINRYNINYADIRFDEVKHMLEHFFELSNITILLCDLEDKKLRDQYILTHNFLLNIEEGLPLIFRTDGFKISNRIVSISGIYTVIKVNLAIIAGMIKNDSMPCNLESLKTLIDKMELISSKVYTLYDLKYVIQGIKKNITNEKSNDYKFNTLLKIYHKYSIHANLGLYFSNCLFEKLPLKASEWNLTIHTLLHKYFLDFDSTSMNLIKAFKFEPFEQLKYLNEIKDSVTENIYEGFTKLLKTELDQFALTSKTSDDNLRSCLRQIILAYNTLAKLIIPNEKDDCKKFINNFIQQKIKGRICIGGDTIYKEIEEFEQFLEVSVDIINCRLNTIVENLVEFNFQNNDFIILNILLNMNYSKVECISNLIDKLYIAISKQISNICRFKSNKSYNECLSYIIKLEEFSKSVNHQNNKDLVFEIQVAWLMHLHKQYNQNDKLIAANWECRISKPIGIYLHEGRVALYKICLMYHSDQPYWKRHLILSIVPRFIFYGSSNFILNCLIYSHITNTNDAATINSPFIVNMRQEVEIYIYKAKIGFFNDLCRATDLYFDKASCFIELIKDLQILLNHQSKPIEATMHSINNSMMELIRLLAKKTDNFTILSIDARIKALNKLQSFFYNGISTQNELYSEKLNIQNTYSLQLNEWYKEVRDTFDYNLSILVKNSYKIKIYISSKELSIELKYLTATRRFTDYYDKSHNEMCIEIFLDWYENRNYFEDIAKFVNNAIDYQNFTLQEIYSKNQNFSQIKDAFLNLNNQILKSLKNIIPSTSKIVCEEIHNTMLVDTAYFTIENALDKQLVFLITEDIANLKSQDELIKLEENALIILNNLEIFIEKWKVQVQIPKFNKILIFLDSKTKVKIIASIETSMENLCYDKMKKTAIEVSTYGLEEFEQNTSYITGEKLKVLKKIKEKTLSIDLSIIEDSKDTKSNL